MVVVVMDVMMYVEEKVVEELDTVVVVVEEVEVVEARTEIATGMEKMRTKIRLKRTKRIAVAGGRGRGRDGE